jgi:hypothetical protein
MVLTAIDWHHEFELSWPSIIGIWALIPGLILLFAEAIVVLGAGTKPLAFKKDDQITLPFLQEWSTRVGSFFADRRIERELGEVECVF